MRRNPSFGTTSSCAAMPSFFSRHWQVGAGWSGTPAARIDTVPELMIIRAFIANGAPIVPIFYDEAGHRVATQYLLSVLNGAMPAEKLLHYREFNSGLPGHPEKRLQPGVEFASGRLGHLWAFCIGLSMANPA